MGAPSRQLFLDLIRRFVGTNPSERGVTPTYPTWPTASQKASSYSYLPTYEKAAAKRASYRSDLQRTFDRLMGAPAPSSDCAAYPGRLNSSSGLIVSQATTKTGLVHGQNLTP